MTTKETGELFLSDVVKLAGPESGISVIDGNYYQTTSRSVSSVFNFSGKNSFIQAEEAKSGSGSSYGIACTGAKGYCILGIDVPNRRLKLSGDVRGLSVGGLRKHWSYSFADTAGTSCLFVSAVSAGTGQYISCGNVTLSKIPSELAECSAFTEEQCLKRYYDDDNGMYLPRNPSIGNLVLGNFFAQHVEGGSSKAIGKYSHAEGRATVADIRYSHAEGTHTFAGGMASHAEGFGWNGSENKAIGRGSHAEGCHTVAIGQGSHAEGGPRDVELGTVRPNVAFGDVSHVEGGGENFAGSRCFNVLGVHGVSAVMSGEGRRKPDDITISNAIRLDSVEGLTWNVISSKPYYSVRLDGNYDFIGRILSVNSVSNIVVCDNLPGYPTSTGQTGTPRFCGNRYDQLWLPDRPDLGTYTLGYGSHAEGFATTACQNGSHSEGTGTIADGKYSHAEGSGTKAGYCAHSEGWNTQALGMYSHAAGIMSVTGRPLANGRIERHDDAYAWSGRRGTTYYSNGAGTFNIDPVGGINGIYVGDRNVNQDVVLQPQDGVYVCETQDEVEQVMKTNLTMDYVYDTWTRFGHFGGKQYGVDSDYNGGSRAGAEKWTFDTGQKTICQTENTTDFTGFVSDKAYYDYRFSARLYSTGGDDDFLGLVIGFVTDLSGRQHTLSLVRSPQTQDTNSFPSRWAMFLDGDGSVQGLNASSTVKLAGYDDDTSSNAYKKIQNEPHRTWNGLGDGVLVDVSRVGNVFTCQTSLFEANKKRGDIRIDSDTKLVVDLDALVRKYASNAAVADRLKLFRDAKVRIGYCTQSQPNAFFQVVTFPDDSDMKLVDLENDRVMTFDFSSRQWKVSTSLTVQGVVPRGRLANNGVTNRLFLNVGSDIVALGGGGVGSGTLRGMKFDLASGAGVMNALSVLIERLGGEVLA